MLVWENRFLRCKWHCSGNIRKLCAMKENIVFDLDLHEKVYCWKNCIRVNGVLVWRNVRYSRAIRRSGSIGKAEGFCFLWENRICRDFR